MLPAKPAAVTDVISAQKPLNACAKTTQRVRTRQLTRQARADLSHALPPPRAISSVDVVVNELTFEAGLPARMPAELMPTRPRLRLPVPYGLVRVAKQPP